MDESSLHKLSLAHPDLQFIFNKADKICPLKIIYSFRSKEEQNKAYIEGKSKLQFPDSKHNENPALAMDAFPLPLDWKDLKRFCFLAGVIFAIAAEKGIKIRWGMDWNKNLNFNDEIFVDACHFELE